MNMKGIILAGGSGTRLYPITKVINKHIVPIGDKPMIMHPLEKLTEANIKEICIVSGPESLGDIIKFLGSGKDFNANLTYKVQDTANGIAGALAVTEDFVKSEPIVVILGDNIFQESIREYVLDYSKNPRGARIFVKEVNDPERFGIAEIHKNEVINIIEKPKNPKSNLCVTGIYFYDKNVFDIIKTIKPSHREELEISGVNLEYLKRGELSHYVLKEWWLDAGTFESLKEANRLVLESKTSRAKVEEMQGR